MIHNLKVQMFNFPVNNESKLLFDFITEIGSCKCAVLLFDLDKDKRPKLFADNYVILGHNADGNSSNPLLIEGMRRIGGMLNDLCDNNGWNLWSY